MLFWGLAVISACLYPLAFSPVGAWPLAFFCLSPLFCALFAAKTRLSAFFKGVLFGAFFSVFMGYWLYESLVEQYEKSPLTAALFLAFCLILPHFLLYGAFGLLFHLLKRKALFFFAVTVPSLWVVTEFSKEWIFGFVPWGHLGYASLGFLPYAQIADIAGVYGLSFLLAGANGGIAFATLGLPGTAGQGNSPPRPRRTALLLLFFIFAPVFYGSIQLARWTPAYKDAIRRDGFAVTLAQGNHTAKERWSGMGFYGRVKAYLALSGVLNEKRPDSAPFRMIVWPETVLNSPQEITDGLFSELVGQAGPNTLLVTGGLRMEKDGAVNCAYFISGSGRVTAYDKKILLPYAETAPAGDILGDYYEAPHKFIRGRGRAATDTDKGLMGASICLEALYPAHVARAVRQGAKILVNLSNDTWFGDSAMPHLHLDANRMRAIENRRFLLRAGNSGFCAIISPTGKVTAKSRLFRQETITGRAALVSGRTIFTLLGNWIVGAGLLLVGFSVWLMRRGD